MYLVLKKTILIDIDGVLNTYTGKFHKDLIPPIKRGANKFLEKLSKKFVIKIFTTRNKLLAAKWLIENTIDKYIEDITNIKDFSWLYIDDKCLTVYGNFSDLINQIDNFKPYYKT